MITTWDIYWITRLDAIGVVLGILWIIPTVLVVTPIIVIVVDIGFDGDWDAFWKFLRKVIAIPLVSLFLWLALPNTKEAVAIYMIPKIVNNEQIKQLPDNAMKFLNEKFEEWIDDMVKKEKK